jgi:hypothetical protein
MTKMQRLGKTATSVRREGSDTVIRYHETDVVCFSVDCIVLDTGGWQTVTTKARMNQAAHQYGLGYSVYQKDFRWYVEYQGKTLPFERRMELKREMQC